MAKVEQFSYDNRIVKNFAYATMLWGLVGMLVGVIIAFQIFLPKLNLGIAYTTFGRLRPLHTNSIIFAFVGNAIFMGVYYSLQRLLKARMFSDILSKLHFWGWQLIIVGAAVTLTLGITTSKEYAELEWPIDILIAVVWVIFGINMIGTIIKRRERYMYVAIWFYIATFFTVAILHIVNSIEIPVGMFKSYPIYAGVQDALVQWWYGHNAVAFFLTTPYLGLMYYFLPKAANRPIYSYRLSIVHFWALIFIYIWAGPHHLLFTALPEWAQSLGTVFSIMLIAPSWGGMLNGLLTLRGAWDKVAKDPILKFYVVGVTFYGMSTFEGPMLSIKTVNALSHFTDWTIAHVHAGALGWNGMMIFGMVYWLAPRLFQTDSMHSKKWMETHFWMGTMGILLYVVAIYGAGLTQGLMWRAFDSEGSLQYPIFLDTVRSLLPMYWVRVVGGTLYIAGAVLCCVNVYLTWKRRPATYAVPTFEAPALTTDYVEPAIGAAPLEGEAVTDFGKTLSNFGSLRWHRKWEGQTFKFSAWVLISVIVASAFEMVPLFLRKATDTPVIAAIKPYSPLELIGRDIYQAEGCTNCHSQMIRPMRSEIVRYGEYSKPGEYVYEHPFLWGSRRIGPDLWREGVLQPSAQWHTLHMNDPQSTSEGSIMPAFPHLLTKDLESEFASIGDHMAVMQLLGVPYSDDQIRNAEAAARAQAKVVNQRIADESANSWGDLSDKEIVAMVAYLLRLGTDLQKATTAGL